MITANCTLRNCLNQIETLSKANYCFVDEIPEFLLKDFKNFSKHKTMSTFLNRIITYDLKEYLHKLIFCGIDYDVCFLLK